MQVDVLSCQRRDFSDTNNLYNQNILSHLSSNTPDTPNNLTGGIVGGGVYELVQKCIASGRLGSVGASIEVAKICVKTIDKPRDFELKTGTTLVTDYDDILNDDSINCVVELMGGVTR